MAKKSTLPSYDVEFIPLERRLEDRRKHADPNYAGPERRRKTGRREDEAPKVKERLQLLA